MVRGLLRAIQGSPRPRRTLVALWIAAMFAHGPSVPAHAQVPTLPLPSDLEPVRPGADVPANVARFAGVWAHGAWDGVLPHALVVESVDAAGRAQVLYVLGDFAEADVAREYRRATGRIVPTC